jgi:hypothetical protein
VLEDQGSVWMQHLMQHPSLTLCVLRAMSLLLLLLLLLLHSCCCRYSPYHQLQRC